MPTLSRWARHPRSRFGWSALASAAIHIAFGLVVATVVVRTPQLAPSIRVSLYQPSPPPPASTAPSQAPSPAQLIAQPQPVARTAPLTRKPMRHIRPRPATEAPAPVPAPASDAAPAPVDIALGRPGGVAGGVAGGTVGGDGSTLASFDAERLPMPIAKINPEYPPVARLRGVEGQVVLEAIVGADGRIEPDITVVQSVPLLDHAAIAALRQWRFRPARNADGIPIRVTLRVPVRFVLR